MLKTTHNIVGEKKKEHSIFLGKAKARRACNWRALATYLTSTGKEVQTSKELLLLKNQPQLPKDWPTAPGVCGQLLLLFSSLWQGLSKPCTWGWHAVPDFPFCAHCKVSVSFLHLPWNHWASAYEYLKEPGGPAARAASRAVSSDLGTSCGSHSWFLNCSLQLPPLPLPHPSPLPVALSSHHLMLCLWASFAGGSPSAVTVSRAWSPSTTIFYVAQSTHSQPQPQAPCASSRTRRYPKNSTPV